MNLPKLQEQIERRALNKLVSDLQKLSADFKYENMPSLIKGVQIEIKNGEGTIFPQMCQIYDCEPVKEAIIEKNLPMYIQKEIDALLK